MALQNHYIPILGNVQNFLASHGVSAANGDGGSSSATAAASAAAAALAAIAGAGKNGSIPIPPLADLDSIEFGVHFAAAAAAAAAAGLPMGRLGSLGMGLAGTNIQTGPAGTTSVDGRANSTSIGAMGPSLLHRSAGLGPTESMEAAWKEGKKEAQERTTLAMCRNRGTQRRGRSPPTSVALQEGLVMQEKAEALRHLIWTKTVQTVFQELMGGFVPRK
jgi:hypothetical protein